MSCVGKNYIMWDSCEDNNDVHFLIEPDRCRDHIQGYQNPNPWKGILTGQVLFLQILEKDQRAGDQLEYKREKLV